MKRNISLKWFVALSFLFLAILLIIGYSFLSVRFFFRGMDNVIGDNMAHAVKSYGDTTSEENMQHLSHFSGYLISRDWSQMPEEIREAMAPPLQVGDLMVSKQQKWLSPPQKIFFVMKLVYKGESLYISHITTRKTAAPLLGRDKKKNMNALVLISFLTALGIFAIVWFLLRQVERPVKALGRWAKQLNPNNLHSPPPDFIYPELNELASLIRNNLSSVHESLERERRFLRHSSHELRTPISVIRNNVELLQRLGESPIPGVSETKKKQNQEHQQKKVIDRIDRASLTMKRLTETLLWLAREKESRLSSKDLDLEQLVRELAAKAEYLLKNKDVEVILETELFSIQAPEEPVRIVIGNLIRNAFQHTWCGMVKISQSRNRIDIVNDVLKENYSSQDIGFGLGLELTRQLCQKLGWEFFSGMESGSYQAHVVFTM
ncbi:sensor histidine kinase [Desulfocicer niacini]